MRSQKLKRPLKNTYFLLRHGQTDANNKKMYMGRLDFVLNDAGRTQAEQVLLPDVPDIVLYSPLRRAKETAELVGQQFGLKNMAADARLIEKAGGDVDGMLYEEIGKEYPQLWGIWDDHPLDYIVGARFPNGESDLEVAQRIENLLVETESTYQNKKLLLVTHSGVVQAARYLLGKSKQDIYFGPLPNCYIEHIN